MKITCPGCQWSADVPEEKIPVDGVTATCRKCQATFPVSRLAVPEPKAEFACPQCGTGQAESDTCIHCKIIFAKFAGKQRNRETAPPVGKISRLQTKSRNGMVLAVTGLLTAILTVAGVIYKTEIASACKLFFRIQPTHARHIPRTALTVTRANIGAILLKTGLKGATDDPVYKKLLEFGAKLYPRFDQLLANPVKESGIELADDVYAFFEMPGDSTPGVGVLFGISDQKRFATFLQQIKPGTPTREAGVSVLKLDGEAHLYWNDSFALIYAGSPKEKGRQRALAIMALNKADSIVSDPLKKSWLEARDDCLVSVDLEKIVRQPGMSFLLQRSPYKAEIYTGSSLSFALNFDKGKLGLDGRVSGTALLAEISKTAAPPTKEFLAGIPTDNYQGFLATRMQLAPLLEGFRLANPEQYRKTAETVELLTKANMEQLADSFTGDLCVVLESFTRRTTEKSLGKDYSGNQLPPVITTETKVDGTIALGVKPDSVAVKMLHKMLQEPSAANSVKLDGKIYKIDSGNGYFVLADNGYIALSTRNEVVKGLAERKKDTKPVMSASLLERSSGALSILELKLSPFFASLSAQDNTPGDTRTSLEQLNSQLTELRVVSRIEKEQAITHGELFFKDETKNSLYQLAALSIALGEKRFAEYRSKDYNAAALADLKKARTCMEAYFADRQQYPASLPEANFTALPGVDVTCEHTAQSYACVAKHRQGNRLYATLSIDAGIRTRQCDKSENPAVPLGIVYDALDRL